MLLLLDENVPRPLRRHLPQHTVRTVAEMGWTGMQNGTLLRKAESQGFDALLTTDRNIQFQQTMAGRRISVVVLVARNNKVETLVPLLPRLETALRALSPGTLVEIVASDLP